MSKACPPPAGWWARGARQPSPTNPPHPPFGKGGRGGISDAIWSFVIGHWSLAISRMIREERPRIIRANTAPARGMAPAPASGCRQAPVWPLPHWREQLCKPPAPPRGTPGPRSPPRYEGSPCSSLSPFPGGTRQGQSPLPAAAGGDNALDSPGPWCARIRALACLSPELPRQSSSRPPALSMDRDRTEAWGPFCHWLHDGRHWPPDGPSEARHPNWRTCGLPLWFPGGPMGPPSPAGRGRRR
jgi:hypothetical protein